MRIKKTSSISLVLKELVREKKWESRLRLHAIFDFWEQAVGRDIADHAWPMHIRGFVLWVGVTDSVWMQHLHLQKNILLETLNARLAAEKLTNIRFDLASPAPHAADCSRLPPSFAPPDNKTCLDIKKATAAIKDPAIRDSLERLLQTFAAPKK